MNFRYLLILVVAFSGSSSLAMSLEEVYSHALKKNHSVPMQKETVYQAEETVSQSYGSLIPTLSLTKQFFWQEKPPVGSNTFNSLSYQPSLALTASQPLFQGFREWEALRKVKNLRDKERAMQKHVELTLYKNVVNSFYTILSLERDLINLTEKRKILHDRIKELERKQKIGRSQLTETLGAKSQAASIDVAAESNRVQLSNARNTFALLTGLPADTKLTDKEIVPDVKSIEFYMGRIKDRPEVRAAQEAAQASADAINIAKADHLPSVALAGNYYFDRPSNQEDIHWDARIVITMPIFAGGVTQSKVRQAYSQATQNDIALDLAQKSARVEIQSLYELVQSDLRQIELTKENVRLSELAFKEEQRSYRFGRATNLDVLTSLTNYIEAKRSFDANQFNLKMHYLTLKAASALL